MTDKDDLEGMMKKIPSEKDQGPTDKQRISQLEEQLQDMKNNYLPQESLVQKISSPKPKKEREPIDIPIKKIVGYGLYAAATAGIIYAADSPALIIAGAIGGLVGFASSDAVGENIGDVRPIYFLNSALFGAGASMLFDTIFFSNMPRGDYQNVLMDLVKGAFAGFGGGKISTVGVLLTQYFFEEK